MPKISGRRGRHQPFVHGYRTVNALKLCRRKFSRKETLQHTFFEKSPIFIRKTVTLRFEPLFGRLRAMYTVQHRLIGEPVVDFLLMIIELFFTRCYDLGATGEYHLEVTVFEVGGSLSPKISGGRGRLPPTVCAGSDRPVNALQLCR